MLEIFTLGGLCIRLNGEVVTDVGLRKAEALLVYLAVINRPVHRSLLADLLWPEYSQTKALTNLRAALAVMHKKFGDYFDISHESVQIKHDIPVFVDVRSLEDKLINGHVDEALDCFKGDFLAGFHVLDSTAFEEWQLSEQRRVRDALISVLHDSLTIAIDTRNITFGLKLAHKLLDLDPYDEPAHQGCMLLHALSGDRTAAVSHYQACVNILKSELNIEPQQETRALFEMISRGETSGLTKTAGYKHNLPESTTSFVGRSVELFKIKKLINNPFCRLITLVGTGGSGKTRLVIEAAKLASENFPDGTFFVSFEEIHSDDMVIPAIAHALNFAIDTFATRLSPENQLLDYLHRRVVLLILDGFEGMTTCAPLLGRLLEKVPGLKILVTSRHRLNLQSEWPYPVDGLPYGEEGVVDLPTPHMEAVRLFTERAKQVSHAYHPSNSELQCIVRICRMVEGMPLAIELAAAWISVMPVDEIEKELFVNLDLLSTERVDVPDRHHSLQAVFENAWDLLTVPQQMLLSNLSVFESSFDREAAAEVALGEISLLSSLVERSLVRCDHQGRFSIHNLIRMFAYEKLAQEPSSLAEIREQYCRYYLNLLTEREVEMTGARMQSTGQVLRQELSHIQKATRWAIADWDQEALCRILTTTLVLYAVYAWYEGVDAFRLLGDLKVKTLTSENDPDPERHPVVLFCRAYQGFLLTNLGQIEESEKISQCCLQPLQAFGYLAEYSVCLHNLGVNASFRGDYETGTDLLEQAVRIGKNSDFILWPTYLLWLGHGYLMLGEYESGLASLQKCREIFMRSETLWGAAFAISKMGLAYDGMGNHIKALEYYQEALTIFEKMGNIAGKGYSLSRMSMSACFTGKHRLAIQFGEEAYQHFEDIGHSWGLASTLPRLGFAHLALDEVEEAHALFLRGLNLSQQFDMAPLSLYALAGIACTMLNGGNQAEAIDLLSYVVVHPKAPMAFLDQPLGKLDPVVLTALKKKTRLRRARGALETIDEVIELFRLC